MTGPVGSAARNTFLNFNILAGEAEEAVIPYFLHTALYPPQMRNAATAAECKKKWDDKVSICYSDCVCPVKHSFSSTASTPSCSRARRASLPTAATILAHSMLSSGIRSTWPIAAVCWPMLRSSRRTPTRSRSTLTLLQATSSRNKKTIQEKRIPRCRWTLRSQKKDLIFSAKRNVCRRTYAIAARRATQFLETHRGRPRTPPMAQPFPLVSKQSRTGRTKTAGAPISRHNTLRTFSVSEFSFPIDLAHQTLPPPVRHRSQHVPDTNCAGSTAGAQRGRQARSCTFRSLTQKIRLPCGFSVLPNTC
jgi:hypothetical protein